MEYKAKQTYNTSEKKSNFLEYSLVRNQKYLDINWDINYFLQSAPHFNDDVDEGNLRSIRRFFIQYLPICFKNYLVLGTRY